MTGETDVLWAAVHKLIRPQRVKIDRQGAPGQPESWLIRAGGDPAGACWVPSHVKALATHKSATVVWATVPSLWEQSTAALFGGEASVGRGSKPLRERSVADLNLMEIRAQIVEGVRAGSEALGQRTPLDAEFAVGEVSRFASLVVAKTPDEIDVTAYRIGSWCRALETYLDAAEHEVRDVRLRNSPCPTCGTRQVTLEQAGDVMVVPALLIKFHNGLVQGAVCEACGDVWWRGVQLEELAQRLGVGLGDTPNTAAAC